MYILSRFGRQTKVNQAVVNTLFNSYVACRFSLNSELHSHSLVTVIGGEEEHFEDFGESNTSELLLESSVGTEGEVDSPDGPPPEHGNGSSLLSPRYELSLKSFCSSQKCL